MRAGIPLLLSLCLSTWTLSASAGAVLEFTDLEPGDGEPIAVVSLAAQDGNLRIERRSLRAPATRSLAIFRAGRLYVVDDAHRTFDVLDGAAGDARTEPGGGRRDARPDAAAEPAREATRQSAPRAARARPVDTGRSLQVGEHACRVWTAEPAERPRVQHCIVPAGRLPGGAEIERSLLALASFWRDVDASTPALAAARDLVEAFDAARGVALWTRALDDGEPRRELTHAREETLGAAMFEVPRGYEQRAAIRQAGREQGRR